MCVVSMVIDHFQPRIPKDFEWPYPPPDLGPVILDFQKAVKAAEIVDQATGQPDCVDKEKAKLKARVRKLKMKLEICELRELLQQMVGAWDGAEKLEPVIEKARKKLNDR